MDIELQSRDNSVEDTRNENEKSAEIIVISSDDVPFTYKNNSRRENKVLSLAENLQRQFKYLYPNRPLPSLFLPNECGIQKIVCTSLCPTVLPYPELNVWNSCAEFVADYLTYVTFVPPITFPIQLVSPEYTLRERKGTSLDLSVVLCSFLIAAGYNAYVVCGYGTRELCLMDEKLKLCPQLQKKEDKIIQKEKKPVFKYLGKPPQDLSSQFEKDQIKKQIQAEKDEEERKRQEELDRIAELEKPPPDPLYGWRVHYWILVLAGQHKIVANFFIEPSTGEKRSVDDPQYVGIEYIWNHQNFWINMQKSEQGCKDLNFDISDIENWEYFLPVDSHGIPLSKKDLQLDESEEYAVSEMPGSWVMPLTISTNDYEGRYPTGTKVNYYKYAKTEKFAPYLLDNGIIRKISAFKDKEYTELKELYEYFSNRADRLVFRKTDYESELVIEEFKEGRLDSLKEHRYHMSESRPDFERIMLHYPLTRVDGLYKRYVAAGRLSEEFESRKDFLISHDVDYYVEKTTEEAESVTLFEKSEEESDKAEKDKNTEEEEKQDKNIEEIEQKDQAEPSKSSEENAVPESVENNSKVTEEHKEENETELPEQNVDETVNSTSEPELETSLSKKESQLEVKSDEQQASSEERVALPKILQVRKKFERNKSLPADEDVELQTFALEDDCIRIDFHPAENRVTASYLEFMKPPVDKEKGIEFDFTEDTWTGFQADYQAKPYSNLYLYQTLVRLMEEERKAIANVHAAEDQIVALLQLRQKEEENPLLEISAFDTKRHEKVKQKREEEVKLAEKESVYQEESGDFLIPYLAKLGFPDDLDEIDAEVVYDDCIQTFIKRMVDFANSLQQELDAENVEFKQKSDYYYRNQGHMTKKQKHEYSEYFKKTSVKIRVMELRLIRHQELAHSKYLNLEKRLNADPRLTAFTTLLK